MDGIFIYVVVVVVVADVIIVFAIVMYYLLMGPKSRFTKPHNYFTESLIQQVK